MKKKILCAFVCLFVFSLYTHLWGFQTENYMDKSQTDTLDVSVVGFRTVSLSGKEMGILKRKVVGNYRKEYGFTDLDTKGRIVGRKSTFNYIDTVPVTLGEVSYQYIVIDDSCKEIAVSLITDRAWPEHLFPQLYMPQHPDWVTLYQKAWKLNWQNMVTSTALPANFGHNDYPDNNLNYVWDACFNSLYQRYASVSGAHPGMAVLDNFYAQQVESGYILRHYHWPTYGTGGKAVKNVPRMSDVNPHLFAWAEWNYFQISSDTIRLRKVLPNLIKYYKFIENYLRTPSGKYVWNHYGSGWDNILTVQRHKYWVELPATQALAAQYIIKIAKVLNLKGVENLFLKEADKKGNELKKYWNKDKNWYCSIGDDGKFTGKTISGMWPVLTGYVSSKKIKEIIRRNLFNSECFFTPMPLPTIAKDENGYNPKGEYWRGGVWINMSLMTIRGLEEQGFTKEAFELSRRTLEGMLEVYQNWKPKPFTIWECYSPEFPAPASHKSREKKSDLGTVRSDFSGWSCGLICLLIENIMGFRIDAPNNTIHWNIHLNEDFGIKHLVFKNTKTDILICGGKVFVNSNNPYILLVDYHGKKHSCPIKKGSNVFKMR